MKTRLPLIVLVVLSTVIGRSFTVSEPGSYDASFFRYVGERWLDGALPYLDVWDNKPPGIFAVLAAVSALFPGSAIAVAVLEALFVVGCVVTVFVLVRRFGAGEPSAALAAAAAALMGNVWFYNEGGTLTELFLLWPSALSMLAFWKGLGSRRTSLIFAAGVCSGMAALFKPPGLAAFLAQAALLGLMTAFGRAEVRTAVRWILVGGAGVVAAWVPAMIYFSWHGGLVEFLSAAVVYPFFYGAGSHSPLVIPAALPRLQPAASLAAAAAMLMLWTIAVGRRDGVLPPFEHERGPGLQYAGVLTCLWVLADLAGALAGGRNYNHYFLALAPSLSAAAGLLHHAMLATVAAGPARRLTALAMAAVIVAPLAFEQTADALRARFAVATEPTLPDDREVVQYLRQHRREGDRLFVWGYRPAIFLWTGMWSPSRFIATHNLRDFPRAREAFGTEILTAIREKRPRFVVDTLESPPDDPYYQSFLSLMKREYVVAHTTTYGTAIYEARATE